MPADPVPVASARYPSLAGGATRAGRWVVIALGFSIPISGALDNVLLAITALLWLATGDWRAKLGAASGDVPGAESSGSRSFSGLPRCRIITKP